MRRWAGRPGPERAAASRCRVGERGEHPAEKATCELSPEQHPGEGTARARTRGGGEADGVTRNWSGTRRQGRGGSVPCGPRSPRCISSRGLRGRVAIAPGGPSPVLPHFTAEETEAQRDGRQGPRRRGRGVQVIPARGSASVAVPRGAGQRPASRPRGRGGRPQAGGGAPGCLGSGARIPTPWSPRGAGGEEAGGRLCAAPGPCL